MASLVVLATAGLIGVIIGVLGEIIARRPQMKEASDAISALVAGFVAILVANFIAPLNLNTVIIASLIVLLPGMALTNAVNELTSQHLVSGVARFAGAMATVLNDQYRLLPAIILAALAAEVVVRRWPAGKSRVFDAVVAFLIPAIVFALYFAALMMTGGIGWTIHLWLGAIVIAGIIGLFLDELSRAAKARSATPE